MKEYVEQKSLTRSTIVLVFAIWTVNLHVTQPIGTDTAVGEYTLILDYKYVCSPLDTNNPSLT